MKDNKATKINEYRDLDESVISTVLKCGLKVYIIKKPGFKKQFAMYSVGYGSNDIRFSSDSEFVDVPKGVAHFLEHKLFEEEKGSVFQRYSAIGAQPNAFTNFTTTAYYFTSTGRFFEALDILISFVNNPYFTDENVEKEKGIIAQEINMYEDNSNWRVYFNLLNQLYNNHPVKNDIAGTEKSISNITKDILYLCYNTFYKPHNMQIVIVADENPDEIIARLNEKFDDVKKTKDEIERVYPEEPYEIANKKKTMPMSVAREIFAFGFKDNTYEDKDILDRLAANNIILQIVGGKSSALYTSLYEQGLIDESFSFDYTAQKDYGYAMFSGESSDSERVYELVLEEFSKIRESGIDEHTFVRIKNKLTGRFIRLLNHPESLGVQFSSMIYKGADLFKYYEKLKSIDIQDLEYYLDKIYIDKYSAVSIIFPDDLKN